METLRTDNEKNRPRSVQTGLIELNSRSIDFQSDQNQNDSKSFKYILIASSPAANF